MNFWRNILPFNLVEVLSPQSKSAENSMSTSRSETADKPNDFQDSSCDRFDSMVKVGNSNSSGMTSAEEIPNAAMKVQLENAKKLMLQFQTFYQDGTAGTYIPPFLEHWIFFALFILHIPDHLSKLSDKLCFDGENIPVLTGYLPTSAATAKGKQTFKTSMEIFTCMCNGEDIPCCIEAKKNRPGYLALVRKTTVATGKIGASDEASTGGEVVGMTFLLTSGQVKQFSSHSAWELRRCILLIKATEWGQPPNKMYLVAGPIVFLSHCCDASTKPTWCDRKESVVRTLTKSVPTSSYGLFLPRACLQSNAFGEGIVSLADSPWSHSECECPRCKSPGLVVEKAATSTSIVNLGDLSQSMKSTSSNDSKDTDAGGRYQHTGDLTLFGDEPFPVALAILHEVIGIESSPRFPRRKLTSTDLATVEQSIITRNKDYEAKNTRFTLVDASQFQMQQQTLRNFLEAMKAARDKDDGNDAGIKFPSELSYADFLFVCHRSYGIPGVEFPTCKIDQSNWAAVEADVVAMEFKTSTIASSDRSRDARELKAFVNSLRCLLSSLDQSTASIKPINGKSQPQMKPSADADRLWKQRVGDDDTELKLPATSPVSSSSHPLGKSRDSSTPLANFASPTVWLSLCKRNRYRILY